MKESFYFMTKSKLQKIKKRDGQTVDWDQSKITSAIYKAITATGQGDGEISKRLSERVAQILKRRFKDEEIPNVEQVQDIVEEVLVLDGLVETAKAYILYREQRRRVREAMKVVDESSEMVDRYLRELDWQIQENANMTFSLQGLNQYAIKEISKKYWLNKIYPKEIREAANNEDFHIHDLEALAPYCAGWDLYDLLLKGFGGVPSKIESRPPKHFRTVLGQLVNFLFTLQGETAGANAVSNFDTLLAPFIRYDNLSYLQVKQSMQEFLYNCMVPTRVGFQSLCWDELVVIKDKGKIKFTEIGKLIDKEFEKNSHRIIEQNPQSYAVQNHEDYYTLSFDFRGKAVWAKVKAFVRHKVPNKSEFVKIKTNRGEAKVSKAHSLFGFKKFDGSFNPQPKSAESIETARHYSHLDKNNHFIALKSFENEGKKESLDLVEVLDELPQLHKNVFVQINPTHTLDTIRANILLEKEALLPFYKEFGLKDRGAWQDWLDKKSIRYEIWRRYGDLSKNFDFKLKNSDCFYPRILKEEVLESFVKLCAWYITEGHTSVSTPLYISQSPSENSKEIIGTLKKLNALGEISENESYSCGKKASGKVFKITGKGLLSEIISRSAGYLSFNKVIPSFIFELSPKYQKLFIETLLKGDGSEYDTHWDFSTTSKKLSLSLSFLLSQNDYKFTVYSEESGNKKWHDRWKVRIYKKHHKIKKKYCVNDFEARACLKVDKFKYDKEHEYDISVDLPQENFAGGSGLLMFHNTPFLNVSLDIKVPEFYKKQPVIIGGKPQKETYGEFQEEMNMFIRAFYEGLMEGDAKGRPMTFPIPTVSITKDFAWDDPSLDPLWEATAKYGVNYFSNFIQSDMSPEDARSMCCRLRLDNRELYKRGGGLFGSAPSTGSIGVVTINMPRIGYLSKTKKEFFDRLGHLMDLAKESLEIKRKALENFMEKGLYPYSKHYLAPVKQLRGGYFGNHFATIGLIGMNEALLNFIEEDIASNRGRKFSLEVLDFMRDRLVQHQEETGNLYNLEATPGEGTAYRQAKADKEKYPDIITAGTKEVPYYTNSSHLPVNYTDDIFEALKLQDELQCKYTGGCLERGNKVLTDKGLLDIAYIVKNFKKLKPIKTLSHNLEKGISEWDEIIKAVSVDVKKHNKIRIKGERNLDIVTSDWHPFFVLEKIKPNPHCPVCEEVVDNVKRFAVHLKWNPECQQKYQVLPKYRVVEKRADELKVGDYILQNSYNVYLEKETELNNDLMWLLGFFIGDGCISKFIDDRGGNNLTRYKLRFFSEHQEALDRVVRILNEYFHCQVKVIRNEKRSEALKEVSTSKKEALDFFFKYGFWDGKKAYKIIIPRKIKENLTKSNVFSFLAGLMDSDGHLNKKNGEFEYYTVSPGLADDILEVCSLAGIMLSKNEKITKRKNEVNIWRIRIPQYEMTKIKNQLTNTFHLSRIKDNLSNRKKRYFPVVRVKETSKVDVKDNQFYDLMTEKNHNYLAGKNCLVFVHNTVLHLFLGEKLSDPATAKNLVRKVFEKFHLPYITLTPTFSICPNHGYINGEHFECPKCIIKQPCEVYSRVVGYLRPLQQWNSGKKEEFRWRKEYRVYGKEKITSLPQEKPPAS